MAFTKDVSHNLEIIREMIGELTPQARSRARDTAKQFQSLLRTLQVNGGENDPGVLLGVALGSCMIAEAMTKEQMGEQLIQLLS